MGVAQGMTPTLRSNTTARDGEVDGLNFVFDLVL